jgi:hypothetical protein
MKAPYCSECTINEAEAPSRVLRSRHRVARAIFGIGCLALAWAALLVPLAIVSWPLALIAGWLGVSHIVAAATGYADCPELGAIPSIVLRRYVWTRCGPWERMDRWLDRQLSADGTG